MKKILNEQSPSSADCGMLQSVMDPNIFNAICAAQCAGNTDGFGNNQALLNIASCCECSEEPSEPTPPSAEDNRALLCRRLMDDIIPNDFDMTGEAWCKKNCKDVYSIVMVDVGGKEINGCKCCSRLDVVGPVPQEPQEQTSGLGDWLNTQTLRTCEPGTNFAPLDGYLVTMSVQEWCDQNHNNPTNQPYTYDNVHINPWITQAHENFQEKCCSEGTSDFASNPPFDVFPYGEYELSPGNTPLIPIPQGIETVPYGTDNYNNPYGALTESLVKRLKKLANIKNKK